jgi:hypothetical protein
MKPHAGAKGGGDIRCSVEEELIQFNGHERLLCEEGLDESEDDNSVLMAHFNYQRADNFS